MLFKSNNRDCSPDAITDRSCSTCLINHSAYRIINRVSYRYLVSYRETYLVIDVGALNGVPEI